MLTPNSVVTIRRRRKMLQNHWLYSLCYTFILVTNIYYDWGFMPLFPLPISPTQSNPLLHGHVYRRDKYGGFFLYNVLSILYYRCEPNLNNVYASCDKSDWGEKGEVIEPVRSVKKSYVPDLGKSRRKRNDLTYYFNNCKNKILRLREK